MFYCPKCQGVNLEPITYRGVTIDKCPRCKGVWLDKGEENFVVEILSHAEGTLCDGCFYFNSKDTRCTKLKIFVKRDFSCSNFMEK